MMVSICCQVCLRRIDSTRSLITFPQRLVNQHRRRLLLTTTKMIEKKSNLLSGDLLQDSIVNVAKNLRNGNITPSQLTELSINRIQSTSRLNAFISVTKDEAKSQANKSDSRFKKDNPLSILDGIPVALKDNFNVRGVRTTCASKMLSNYVSPYDATVTKLLKEAGCVIVGKTNMDEFAIGSGNVDSEFGPCVNPWNSGLSFTTSDDFSNHHSDCQLVDCDKLSPDFYVPGGSSGGSAVAVASGAVFAALGSDTGGSNRYPAAMTGIVGFKPTYGLISRHGLIPLSHTLDTVGILTRHVEDASIVFDALRGFDELDSTSSRTQSIVSTKFDRNLDLSGLRVGIPDEYFVSFMSDEIVDIVTKIGQMLAEAGCVVSRVSLPHTKYASATYTVINATELASNFSCYDGIEYGHRSKDNPSGHVTLEELYNQTRNEGFGDAVKGRIQAGNYFLLKGNYDNFVRPAMKARRKIYEDFEAVLDMRRSSDREENKVDLLLTPMTLGPAKKFKDWKSKDNRELSAVEDICAQPANLAGVPAISIPCQLTNRDSLPLAVQLISAPFTDNFLLSAAHQVERMVDFPALRYVKACLPKSSTNSVQFIN